MLIGNKSDLDEQRDVPYEEAAAFAEENGVFFVFCFVLFFLSPLFFFSSFLTFLLRLFFLFWL